MQIKKCFACILKTAWQNPSELTLTDDKKNRILMRNIFGHILFFPEQCGRKYFSCRFVRTLPESKRMPCLFFFISTGKMNY